MVEVRSHPLCLRHRPPAGHPEIPARVIPTLLAALLTGVIYAPGLSGTLYLDSTKLYQVEQDTTMNGQARCCLDITVTALDQVNQVTKPTLLAITDIGLNPQQSITT